MVKKLTKLGTWLAYGIGGEGAAITVEECVQGMLETVDQLGDGDSGSLLRYDGTRWESW